MNSSLLSGFTARTLRVAAIFLSITAILIGGFFISQAHANNNNVFITSPLSGAYVRGMTTINWTDNATTTTTTTTKADGTFNVSWSTDNFGNNNAVATTTVGILNGLYSGSQDWDTSNVDNGTTYKVRVTDSNNSWGQSDVFTVDNTAPTTTLATSSPATPDGTNGWYKTKPTITLTCTDNLSGCSSINYAWYNATSSAQVGNSVKVNSSNTAIINATDVPQGDNILKYYSEDNAVDNSPTPKHNVEAVQTAEFKVDTTLPSINSYTLNGGTSDVYFNPSNTNSNLASTTIAITAAEPVKFTEIYLCKNSVTSCNGSNSNYVKNFTQSSSYSTNVTKQWDGKNSGSSIVTDGAYKLGVSIIDIAGNQTSVDLSTLTTHPHPTINIDTAAPTIVNGQITSPVANNVYTSADILTFTPKDTGGTNSTPITCGYSLNGAATTTSSCTSGHAVTNGEVTGLNDGRNTIAVQVTDAAGNTVSTAPVSFVYNNDKTLTVGTVPTQDFSTIQDAVSAATNGDTIDIYSVSSPYAESVNVNKQLTIENAPTATATSTIDGQMTISHDGVIVQGLKFTNPGATTALFISDASHVTVKGNTFDAVGTTLSKGSAQAIYIHSGSSLMSDINILNNKITNVGNINLLHGTPGGSAKGIFIGDSTGTNTISSVTIDGNNITNITASTAAWIDKNAGYGGGAGAYGILVNHAISGAGSTGVTITHNTINNLNGHWATAIGLEGNTPSADVEYNHISDITYPGVAFNIQDNTGASSVKIHNNTIDNATVPAFVSNFVSGSTVDATNNYWGTAVYATIAGKIFNIPSAPSSTLLGTVTFAPYYVNKVGGILSSDSVSNVYVNGTYTDGGTITPPQNSSNTLYFGYNAFATIQNGVNATALSTNGTVHVAAGIYTGDVTVGKTLSILGPNAAIDPNGTPSSRSPEATIKGSVTVNAGSVKIKGFTINPTGTVGITVPAAQSGENFSYNIFNGISGTGAKGIYLASGQSGITIANNLFSNITSSTSAIWSAVYGIFIGEHSTGTVAASTGITINDNTFDHITSTAQGQYAIAYGVYTDNSTGAGLTITDNTFSNLSGFGTHAIGLEGPTPNTSVTGNTFTSLSATATGQLTASDKFGIFFQDNSDSGSVTISSNKFDASNSSFGGVGVYPSDSFTSGNSVHAAKNWWNSIEGPYTGPVSQLGGSSNPHGTGAYVSPQVDFVPWCTAADCASVDISIPTATLSNKPASPTNVTSISVTVGATSSDNVAYYKYQIDGGTLSAETAVGTPITASTTLTDGSHTLNVLGRDQAGNWQTTPTTYAWTVDTVKPTLSDVSIVSNNANGTNTTYAKEGNIVTLRFTSSEQIQKPVVTIDGSSAANVVNSTGNKWTATYTMASGDTQGNILFTINYTDMAGNDGTAVIATNNNPSVFYDRVVPTVSAGTDKDVHMTTTQNATVTDAPPSSQIASIAWTKVSGPGTVTFSSPTTAGTNISASVDGTYVLQLTATDNAGNTAYKQMTFIWDTTNPYVVTSVPVGGAQNVSTTTSVSVVFNEDVKGLNANKVSLVDNSTGASVAGVATLSGDTITIPDAVLTPNTTYRINVAPGAVKDMANNNLTTNFVSHFTTSATPDTTAPAIPVIATTATTVNANTYTITGTDASDGGQRIIRLYNGANSAGTYVLAAGDTSWSILAPLTQNTDNVFTAKATDAVGNTSIASVSVTITEQAPEAITPAVTLSGDPILPSYTATEAVSRFTSGLQFNTTNTQSVTVNGVSVTPYTGGTVTVASAANAVTIGVHAYSVIVTSSTGDTANISVAYQIVADPIVSAPIITNIQAMNISTSTAAIWWTTDKSATSQIEYGLTSGYGMTEASSSATTHKVVLTGLTPNTTYHFHVVSTASSKTTTSGDNTFTTAVDNSTATLAVTGISAVPNADGSTGYAVAGGDFVQGWKWTFHVTVPTNEKYLSMKFDDFVGAGGTIPVASNLRFYSAQAATVTASTTAITINGSNAYSAPMLLSGDTSPSTAGRQVDITVEMRVPTGTTGGSYSTGYGIDTATTTTSL